MTAAFDELDRAWHNLMFVVARELRLFDLLDWIVDVVGNDDGTPSR